MSAEKFEIEEDGKKLTGKIVGKKDKYMWLVLWSDGETTEEPIKTEFKNLKKGLQ